MISPPPFTGFTPATIAFLTELSANNNKGWFELQLERYQRDVVPPFRALVSDLSGAMLSIDDKLVTTPAISKTISRLHRDTRFSHDKSPYRSNVWLVFRRPLDERLYTAELADELRAAFSACAPLYHFLWSLLSRKS